MRPQQSGPTRGAAAFSRMRHPAPFFQLFRVITTSCKRYSLAESVHGQETYNVVKVELINETTSPAARPHGHDTFPKAIQISIPTAASISILNAGPWLIPAAF
ncbi:hypothetical protein EVAR_18156_1 [Eumeta japonica]|uniref:Uncharacterized protein n=1 Tax=Eumeta variegata TaxID=151549 RepID=A0A4C1UWG1_EUMVA|nr:hypothetical protein EVAR_18156_1 [Eumeta japonica]